MRLIKNYIVFAVAFLICNMSFAQNGEYDVRVLTDCSGIGDDELSLEIQVRATDDQSTFEIAQQNYRFTYNADMVTFARLEDSGLTAGASPFIYTHSTTGYPGVMSYNVEAGGLAALIDETAWVTVGLIVFDIIDDTETLDFVWHDETMFPPTSIMERFGGVNFATTGNGYVDGTTDCFALRSNVTQSTGTGKDVTGVEVFPIPAKESVTLQYNSSNTDKTNLIITDAVGKIVQQQQLETLQGLNVTHIDMTNLSSGIYFMTIDNQQGREIIKVVKE